MSADRSTVSHSWQVGRFTVTLNVPLTSSSHLVSAVVEWEPHLPQTLTPDELEAYRRGRDAAFQALGLDALVIDT